MTNTSTFPGTLLDGGLTLSPAPQLLNDLWTAVLTGNAAPPVAEADDARWVAQVRAGDEEAARALVRRLYPLVIRLIRCRLPRRATEEDLAQTVFAKIFSKLDQFSGCVPLEHWVSRIVVNTCFNQLRHEMVRPELRMSDLSGEEENVVQQLASAETDLPDSCRAAARELVEKLLKRLTPDERLVVTLLHLEEKSVRQICHVTGWSSAAVKVRAFRARQKMRRLWKTLLAGERA
jgi:RNA polymerase sigma factor (sigma-70 family)